MKRLPSDRGLLLFLLVALAAGSAFAAPPEIVIDNYSTTIRTTPGARIAFFATDQYGLVDTAIITDDDRDGSFVLGYILLKTVIAVDLASGEYTVAGVPMTEGFPNQLLVRGPSGEYTVMLIPHGGIWAFWVRPGTGAWFPRFGAPPDQEDPEYNNRSTTSSLVTFRAVEGSPGAPSGARPGDLLFLMSIDSAYGGRVDPLLSAPRTPGAITMLPGSPSKPEGQPHTVTLLRTGGTEGTVSVRCCTQDSGNAVAGLDYVPIDEVVTFAPGEVLARVTLHTIHDREWTGNRHVSLRPESPTGGATIGEPRTSTFSIREEDSAPRLDIEVTDSMVETDGVVQIPVTLSVHGAWRYPVTVAYGLNATTSLVVFQPNESRKEVLVPFFGNDIPESDYTALILGMLLEAGVPASRSVQIVDDDPPTLSIPDLTVIEGFGRFLEPRVEKGLWQRVRFSWRTVDGTAKAGSDYIAASGQATAADHRMYVEIERDSQAEETEYFYIELTDFTHVIPTVTRITVTILDDDGLPLPAFEGLRATETNQTHLFDARLVLPRPLLIAQTYHLEAASITALPLSDYNMVQSSVTFQPGETVVTFPVQIIGDDFDEPEETFELSLWNTSVRAVFTIVDDDVPDDRPYVVLEDATVTEGTGAEAQLRMRISLSAFAPRAVSIRYATRAASATAGSDYTHAEGVIQFAPGEFRKEIVVAIAGDRFAEEAEQFFVSLSQPDGLKISRGTATATIVDDDEPSSRRRSVRQ